MKAKYPKIGLGTLCRLFGISRQAYYQHLKRAQHRYYQELIVVDQVCKIRRTQPKIGGRKLYFLLKDQLARQGIKMGRDHFFKVLGQHQLLVKTRRNSRKTTYSYHWFKKYSNLIKTIDEVVAPNRVWVSDITYLPLGSGYCYLSLITDSYSRKIVGYHLSNDLKADSSMKALLMAIESWDKRSPELIHHSDRGIQYCCHQYVDILKGHNILISMTNNGDPYENPIAERVNGILKQELLQLPLKNVEQAQHEVRKSIHIYNEQRPHLSCQMLTPSQAHQSNGKLIKLWKNYYKQKNIETVNPFQDNHSQ